MSSSPSQGYGSSAGGPESYPPPPPAGSPSYPQAPTYQSAPPVPAPPGAATTPTAGSTNGLAIASMILGILWLYWVGSILALIFGYLARRQIKERNQSGDGMAIAGIVLGWIGVGVLVLLVIIGIVGAATSNQY